MTSSVPVVQSPSRASRSVRSPDEPIGVSALAEGSAGSPAPRARVFLAPYLVLVFQVVSGPADRVLLAGRQMLARESVGGERARRSRLGRDESTVPCAHGSAATGPCRSLERGGRDVGVRRHSRSRWVRGRARRGSRPKVRSTAGRRSSSSMGSRQMRRHDAEVVETGALRRVFRRFSVRSSPHRRSGQSSVAGSFTLQPRSPFPRTVKTLVG